MGFLERSEQIKRNFENYMDVNPFDVCQMLKVKQFLKKAGMATDATSDTQIINCILAAQGKKLHRNLTAVKKSRFYA